MTEPGTNVPAWVTLGAGAAAVVAGAVVGGLSLHNLSAADKEPYAHDAQARHDAGVRLGIGAIISLSVGAVAAGTGGALLVFD